MCAPAVSVCSSRWQEFEGTYDGWLVMGSVSLNSFTTYVCWCVCSVGHTSLLHSSFSHTYIRALIMWKIVRRAKQVCIKFCSPKVYDSSLHAHPVSRFRSDTVSSVLPRVPVLQRLSSLLGLVGHTPRLYRHYCHHC